MATIDGIKVAPPPDGRPDTTEDNDMHVVQVSDVGGNGRPSIAVFMPVKKVANRCELVIGVAAKDQPYTVDELFGHSGALVYRQPEGTSAIPPYQFRIPKGQWPSSGDFVLMLLVYPQSGNLGQSHNHLFSLPLDHAHAPQWAGLLDSVKLDPPKVGQLEAIAAKLNQIIQFSNWSALSNGLMPKDL